MRVDASVVCVSIWTGHPVCINVCEVSGIFKCDSARVCKTYPGNRHVYVVGHAPSALPPLRMYAYAYAYIHTCTAMKRIRRMRMCMRICSGMPTFHIATQPTDAYTRALARK